MAAEDGFRFRAEHFENDPSFRNPEQFAESQARLTNLSKPEAKALQELGDWVNENLVLCLSAGFEPHSSETQEVIAKHYLWANTVWDLDKESYLKLADTYENQPRYRGFYERIHSGLSDYLATAMRSYANSKL